MDLQNQALGSGGDSGTGHGGHQFAATGSMAGVNDDGEVGQFMEQWYTGKIKHIACVGIEAANAAFTENDVGIARGYNVLGGQQPLVDGRCKAALEHDWSSQTVATSRQQEWEVLHVATAYLQDVGVLRYRFDQFRFHHLGDDGESRDGSCFGK